MSNEMNEKGDGRLPVGQPQDPLAAEGSPAEPKGPALDDIMPEPFSAQDLRRAVTRPHLLAEYVLGSKERLGTTLSGGKAIWPLAGLLMAASVLSTIPYGMLSPTGSPWKVAALFTGSLLICFPCLYMFGQFLGLGLSVARSLVLALIVTSTTGLFTFAFSPIIWFITFSVEAVPELAVSPRHLSVFLLGLSLLLGVVQMDRCLREPDALLRRFPHVLLLVAPWLALLVFITYRMARLLGVL